MNRYFQKLKAAPHVAGIATAVNTVAPVISGGGAAGDTYTTTDGTWTNSSDFTYQWYRGTILIAGATTNSVVTSVSWAGQSLTCVVYGGNGAGKIAATSNAIVLS